MRVRNQAKAHSEPAGMKTTRRSFLAGSLATGALTSLGCSAAPARAPEGGALVHVMGTIHRRHRTSTAYSLAVFKEAVRKAAPDVILTEIPPQRAERALREFRETGAIQEPRTRVFPEYTDVIFPLAEELGFRILGTAAWTSEIAQSRRAALKRIQDDPARADQWAEHRAATRAFAREVAGRSDDPDFIHTDAFDALVKASREPYARHFDADLGAGGWTQINAAHNALIHAALDTIAGQGKRALITFGTAHKYKIRESLALRQDIALQDTQALFG